MAEGAGAGGLTACLSRCFQLSVPGGHCAVVSGFLIGCQAQCCRKGGPHVILSECI